MSGRRRSGRLRRPVSIDAAARVFEIVYSYAGGFIFVTPTFADLLTAVLGTLRAFDTVQARLDPSRLAEYDVALRPHGDALARATEALAAVQTGELVGPDGRLLRAAALLLKACTRFRTAAEGPAGIQNAFLALRSVCRATEELYSFAGDVPDVDHYFRDGSAARVDTSLPENAQGAPDDAVRRGVIPFENERSVRGGHTLYVPERYSPARAWPLLVACHGGSGHGADFLWTWVREARTFGFLVLAPTSAGRTWSLGAPFADARTLKTVVARTVAEYNIDASRVLLTGISDGGTFALLSALLGGGGFTHFACLAAALHAFAGQTEALERLSGVPVYQVHGGRDWMFPVAGARLARAALERAGARLVYREIDDLSHNYPRDENPAIVRWWLGDG